MSDKKVVLVSGGSQGIGKAIVESFAGSGAQTIFFGRNAEKGNLAAKEIQQKTGNADVHFFAVDVSSFQQVDEAVKKIVEQFGKIDVLINNAGITKDNLILRMNEGEWDQVIGANLKSCFNLAKVVIRPMLKAKKGAIINISSVVGVSGNPGQTNYAASKAGMIGFAKSLAKEVARKNITVNCIAPGFIETPMTEALTDEQRHMALERIPLHRLGKPEDIASAALFLASADYITGQVLVVDGGMIM